MTKLKGKLFLIPSPIHEEGLAGISNETISVIHSLDHFIVERARTARRYISATKHPKAIEQLMIDEMPETEINEKDIEAALISMKEGKNIGLMSEAGLPAVADPGSRYVRIAQKLGIPVVPLAGPSSIMLALMGSGLEGQRFAFHGYLSAKKNELPAQLKQLMHRADQDDATQIWIEAPYRNKQILEAIEKTVNAGRNFCIAAGIGSDDGFVMTKEVGEWKRVGWPEIHKVPAVFLLK